jgi:hypothetical protein
MSAIPQPIVHLVVAQHHLPQREAEGETTCRNISRIVQPRTKTDANQIRKCKK